MSHDIDESTGKPAMAYVGEVPWHGLGQALPPGQDIDVWVKAAGLDWDIEMLPVRYQMNDQSYVMSDRFVLARSDTQAALSVVSGDYQVVQPKAVLEFYRDLVEQRGYQLETAGALAGGRKVWALARTGLVAGVADDAADKLGAYVLLATSCDKTLATTVTFTSVRVVCQNTLSFAVRDMKKGNRRNIKVAHSLRFDPAQIKNDLGLMDESWEKFKQQLTPMAGKQLSKGDAEQFFVVLRSFAQGADDIAGGDLDGQRSERADWFVWCVRRDAGVVGYLPQPAEQGPAREQQGSGLAVRGSSRQQCH